MKRSRFSEEQIIGVLEEAEATSVKGVDKSCMKCIYTTYACEITNEERARNYSELRLLEGTNGGARRYPRL